MSISDWKTLLIVVPLIATCLILSGCVDDEGDDELDFEGKVYSDRDTVVITVKGGDVNWSGKEVRVDNNRLITSLVSSEDGDEVEFVDTTGIFEAEEGTKYLVKIVYSLTSEVLWEDNITAERKDTETVPSFTISCSIDASEDTVDLKMVSGEITWNEYSIRVDGLSLNTNSTESEPGDTAKFYDPDGGWDAEAGEDYNLKIINLSENQVVYEKDIIATV